MNFTVIPEAITFTIVLKENLKLGIGLFNSSIRRSLLTEEVTTAPDISPEVTAAGGRSSRNKFHHVSGGLAGTLGKKQNVWLGGTLDIVVGNSRIDSTRVFTFDQGESGFVTEGEISVEISFGLQLKAGLQWAPIKEIRVGFSVATPTYAFILINRFATTFGQSPRWACPFLLVMGTPRRRTAHSTAGYGEVGGALSPATRRLGIAYVGTWGWIEGDLVAQWRLRTPELGIDLKTIVNGRVGSAFRLTRFMKLGVGVFTRSKPNRPDSGHSGGYHRHRFLRRASGLSLFKPRGSS